MIYLDVQGARIPALGFGTFQLPANVTTYMVEAALEMGYRHIDTAQIYDTELNVGWGMRRSSLDREDYFITTKVWVDPIRERRIAASVEDSLRKLQTDYIDLLLLHWPTTDMDMQYGLDTLVELKEAGKIRHIGVSNYNCVQLNKAREICSQALITNQVEYHAYLNQDKMLNQIRKHKMLLTAYSPLSQGKLIEDKNLIEIAQAHNKSTSQIALRWLLQQSQVITIPRSSKPEHAEENLQVFDFKLSEEEMSVIHRLARNDGRIIDPAHLAPEWD